MSIRMDEIKDPRLRARIEDALGARATIAEESAAAGETPGVADVKQPRASRIRQSSKPLMNHTELRCLALLESRGVVNIMQQAITLRLDPPFRSYRPDLAYIGVSGLVLVEVKGQHRFRRAGIAKVALAAKTYPQFRFELFEWDSKVWKESVLSP